MAFFNSANFSRIQGLYFTGILNKIIPFQIFLVCKIKQKVKE